MKNAALLFLLFIFIACNGTQTNELNGTWIPVQQEMGGNPLPAAFMTNQKLVLNDKSYTVIAESIDKGMVHTSGDKMDIYGKEGVNKGKHFMALFKCENEQLTICYNLSGKSYPESFDTKNKPLFFLSVYKRAETK